MVREDREAEIGKGRLIIDVDLAVEKDRANAVHDAAEPCQRTRTGTTHQIFHGNQIA